MKYLPALLAFISGYLVSFCFSFGEEPQKREMIISEKGTITSEVRIKACVDLKDKISFFSGNLFWQTYPKPKDLAYRPGENPGCKPNEITRITIDRSLFSLPLEEGRYWQEFVSEINQPNPPLDVPFVRYWAQWLARINLEEWWIYADESKKIEIRELQIKDMPLNGSVEIANETGNSVIKMSNPKDEPGWYDFSFLIEYTPKYLLSEE
jgi:hypothetical protein